MGLQPRYARRFVSVIAVIAAWLGLAFIFPVDSPAAPGDFGWHSLGGQITSSADIAQLGDGTALFVARGTDGAAWAHVLEPDDKIGEGTWFTLGGQIVGGPAISGTIAEAPEPDTGRLDVFARGVDDALWTRSFNATVGVWTPWTNLGGILTSEPSAIAFGDPDDTSLPTSLRIVVFARGRDNAMWKRELVGTLGWGPWQSAGGLLTSAPGAGGHPSFFVGTVAVRGSDNAVWYQTYDGETGAMSGWLNGGGVTNAAPSAEFFCTPALWARGTNNAIWHAVTDPHTGWVSYAGRARSGPGTHTDLFAALWYAAARGADDGLWFTGDLINADEAHCGSGSSARAAHSSGDAPAWMEGLR